MNFLKVLTLLLFIFLPFSDSSDNIVKIDNNRIIDSQNRERIFHGVNVVYKGGNWHPQITDFNPTTSFAKKDILLLKDLGLNAVRLGVMWPGVEPERGNYNTSYLDVLGGIVNSLEKEDMYFILDFHQDVFSEYFCGEGVPNWYIENDFKNISLSFPLPLGLPFSKIPPTKEDCEKHSWFDYQFSNDAGKAYENLYLNPEPWINFWEIVVSYFKNYSNLIGYELFNEPWAGDIYSQPSLLYPGETDRKYLLPLYTEVHNRIREIDKNHLIFYSSVTWDDFKVGFDELPEPSKAVLSYHCYIPPNYSLEKCISSRINDIIRLGVGGFMTEFEDALMSLR